MATNRKPTKKTPKIKATEKPMTPPAEIQLDSDRGLRIVLGVTALERDRARVELLRATFSRLLAELDKDGTLRNIDVQLGELNRQIVERERELAGTFTELGKEFGINPNEYSLDEKTFVLRRSQAKEG
jgi:hypothetical protein